MSLPLVIGITGNIGSGKSTAAILFEQHIDASGESAVIVDADEIVRALQRPGQPGWSAIVEKFGIGILDPVTEEIDRPALARIAFQSSENREALNRLIHPLVRFEERRLIDEAQAEGAHVLLVVPLLIETGLQDWCDHVVVLTVPPEKRVERLQRHRDMTPEQIAARLAGQLPEEELVRHATLVLDNGGDIAALRAQVRQAWVEIRHGARD